MSLKVLAIVGGLAAVGAVGIPVAYVSLKDKTDRSYTESKTKIWFENGECKYEKSSSSVNVGRTNGREPKEHISSPCLKLLDGDPDWQNWDIDWDKVPQKYESKKTAWDNWRQANQNSQTVG